MSKLKSAWELALEKMESDDDLSVNKLDDEQRNAIAEIRSRFRAKIAEEEFGHQSRVSAVISAGDVEKLPVIKDRLQSEIARLNREMEKAIEAVRRGGSS